MDGITEHIEALGSSLSEGQRERYETAALALLRRSGGASETELLELLEQVRRDG